MDATADCEAQKPNVPALRYRPEIDGLRAIAVLAVVFFHAKLGCTGGYIGVDVFFVISGFLITSLILRDIQTSNFKAVDFWERRIRRIAPAFVVTTLATLVAAWLLFLPDDFDRVGRAVMAQTLFGSNIYHWRVSGYFAPAAETLPLLHTWSLAVEEQFYIILPIALVLVGAWRRSWLSPAIALACAASFGLGVWATPKHPGAAFFLLPTRAWELLLGSLIAGYPTWGSGTPRWAREAISLIGLSAIGISAALFDSLTPFPGVAALLPCLGSVAFIWANRSDITTGGRILAWRPFVFIGQISYSFYLLHWPILVFSLYWFWTEVTWAGRLGLVAATFLLAVLSWMLVETPVRKKWVLSRRRALFSAAACSMFLLLSCGQLVKVNQGFPSRFGPRTLEYAASHNDSASVVEADLQAVESGKLAQIGAGEGPVRCLLWGDSHAMALTPTLDFILRKEGIRGLGAMRSGTPPLLGFAVRNTSPSEESRRFNAAVVKFAIERRVQTVVMAGVWAAYAEAPLFEECLRETVNTLTSAGLRVVIVRDIPSHIGDVPRLLARATLFGQDVQTVGITLEKHRATNKKADELIERLAGPNVTILDPAPYFVDQAGLCRVEFEGKAMYHDFHHLSVQGALRLVPLFERIF